MRIERDAVLRAGGIDGGVNSDDADELLRVTTGGPYNVLFLCTGNSARSIIAEAILKEMAAGRFNAYSAGSAPKGEMHPLALEQLVLHHIPTKGLASKAWDVFAAPGAPVIDFVITVCDNAAGEVCPVWPGQPVTAHWSVPDPAAEQGTDEQQRKAFSSAFDMLVARIRQLTNLPLEALDRSTQKLRLDDIGRNTV